MPVLSSTHTVARPRCSSAAPLFIDIPRRLAVEMPQRKAMGTPIAAGHGVAAIRTARTRRQSVSTLVPAPAAEPQRCHQKAPAQSASVKGVKSDAMRMELRSSTDFLSRAAASACLNRAIVDSA